MDDFNIQRLNPEELRQQYAELTEAQLQALENTKTLGKAVNENVVATGRGVASMASAIKGVQIASSLKEVGKTARIENDLIGKSLSEQASTVASHYQKLSGTIGSLISSTGKRAQQSLDRQTKTIRATIEEAEANISFLQEAEQNASGSRKASLQQEIAVRNASVQQEKNNILQIEEAKKQSAIRSARRQKSLDVFAATATAARAILAAIAAPPGFPFNAASVAITSALSAAQLATVIAQPLPQFRQGGLLSGPKHEGGGIRVEAEGGEFITSAKQTRKYLPVLEAINNGKADPILSHSPAHTFSGKEIAKALSKEIARLPREQHVFNEKGYRRVVIDQNSRTQYHNARYRN